MNNSEAYKAKDSTIAEAHALRNFYSAHENLYKQGVLINKKDFTCQIGEWLIEKIYNGKRAESGIQRGWDVEANGKFIQVKAHSKAEGNNNRWSTVEKFPTVIVDELIIVVFTHNYKLKEFYKVPWEKAVHYIKERGQKKKRFEINWNNLSEYRIDIYKLPNQEVVSIFL